MERSTYAPLAPSSEGPNPLRPYYRPPSVGTFEHSASTHAAPSNTTAPVNSRGAVHTTSPSFGTAARDILSDINYTDLLGDVRGADGQSGLSVRGLLDQAIWKYSSVFMAQPFEVAKLVLQCRLAGVEDGTPQSRPGMDGVRRASAARGAFHDVVEEDDEEEDDGSSYFTSAAPGSPYTPRRSSRQNIQRTPSGMSPSPQVKPSQPASPLHRLDLRRPDSLVEVISQLWTREGAWGIWKGTNATFLYTLLMRTIETWTRSILAAALNIPDPGLLASSTGSVGGLDIIDSPSPLSSLGVAVAAAGFAGLLLAPLDIVRTRIMLTSTTDRPRSLLACLKQLPSWICPSSLVAPTLLNCTIPSLVSCSTPLILRSTFRIDPIITPATYSVCTFLSSTAELFVKLPIETVLRRGQINYAAESALSSPARQKRPSNARVAPSQQSPLKTVVEVGSYTGIVSTMWRIAREEGESYEKTDATTKGAPGTSAHRPVYSRKKGQGVQGLWRGWRVGWWGLVGVWGAAAMGGAGKGGEF